jgi:Uma2 family endonuclease
MALAPIDIKRSPDEYLQHELSAEIKHEYVNGYMVAMVGVSRNHNLIALSLATRIKSHLKGKACRIYISDMKLRIATQSNDQFHYPDLMVSCDDNPPSEYFEDKPLLVIEALSPSTETRGKLEKLSAYSRKPGIREYLTVSQEKFEIQRYALCSGSAQRVEYRKADQILLESIGLTLSVKAIYEDVVDEIS